MIPLIGLPSAGRTGEAWFSHASRDVTGIRSVMCSNKPGGTVSKPYIRATSARASAWRGSPGSVAAQNSS
ncbi:hypothetical protein CFP66_35995 [Pseudonocardia sp. MH-G8]|nr:hypothetical protein CFP66_35995 [Pseudonocardia sp. MH-G8]